MKPLSYLLVLPKICSIILFQNSTHSFATLAAQGEGHAAVLCCEKAELVALAAKCVGAWEVQRILRCAAALQGSTRHSYILRVRTPCTKAAPYRQACSALHICAHSDLVWKQIVCWARATFLIFATVWMCVT